MNGRRLLVAAWASCILAGCSIGRPIPEPTQYVIDPPPKAVIRAGKLSIEAVRMGNVRVAAPYAGSMLVYRLDDVRYASDPYHVFEADPGAMLGSRMAEWLDESGPFRAVAQPGSSQPATAVLEATVTELYGDFRLGHSPAAVLAVQFTLIGQESARPMVLYERTIGRRIILPKASPDALVRGYAIALAQILTQLTTDLVAATPGAQP